MELELLLLQKNHIFIFGFLIIYLDQNFQETCFLIPYLMFT